MSTRATYEFIDETRSKPLRATVYIHHDGYLAGAGAYLYRAMCSDGRGNLLVRFIRANERAEITGSHAEHGDTDYRYTITIRAPFSDSTVEMRARAGERQYRRRGEWPIADFISLARADGAELFDSITGLEWSKFRVVPWGHYFLNAISARKMLERSREVIKNRAANGYESERELREVANLVKEFPELEGAVKCGGE